MSRTTYVKPFIEKGIKFTLYVTTVEVAPNRHEVIEVRKIIDDCLPSGRVVSSQTSKRSTGRKKK